MIMMMIYKTCSVSCVTLLHDQEKIMKVWTGDQLLTRFKAIANTDQEFYRAFLNAWIASVKYVDCMNIVYRKTETLNTTAKRRALYASAYALLFQHVLSHRDLDLDLWPFDPKAFISVPHRITDVHRVSKKTVQTYFCQNFAKFRQIVKVFGTKIAERTCFSEVYSFSTSPKLVNALPC